LPWFLSHQSWTYIHISSLFVRLYGTNKVSVIEVLETSWCVFCIQNCDHFHHVIKVTTEFCSPSKFSRWTAVHSNSSFYYLLHTYYKNMSF
jgi:hypothetical protein